MEREQTNRERERVTKTRPEKIMNRAFKPNPNSFTLIKNSHIIIISILYEFFYFLRD